MSKQLTYSLILGVVIALLGFRKPEKLPADLAREQYHVQLREWEHSVEFLLKEVDRQNNVSAIRKAFHKSRLSFKAVEALLCYYDEQAVLDHINGAPLPKLERNAPELVVIQPSGYQVIEETLYAEQLDRTALIQLVRKLHNQTSNIVNMQLRRKVIDRHLIEAARFQVIRILSMGVTGFDTPSSTGTMEEVSVTLDALLQVGELYEPYLPDSLNQELKAVRNASSTILSNASFEGLDRIQLARQCLQPLFAHFLKIQNVLDIETYYESQGTASPFNYTNSQIHSTQLLKAEYYAQITTKQSRKLKLLGQQLFHDPILSGNNKRSCASCHNASKGFSDQVARSPSFDGTGVLGRNTPGLINAVYADRYFHDLRATELRFQFSHVVHSAKEFNTSYSSILSKLNACEKYQLTFKKAFNTDNIKKHHVELALQAYVASLTDMTSTVDQYINGQLDELSNDVKHGYNLFMGKAACGTCHFAPLYAGTVPPRFTESESEVLGVTTTFDTLSPKMDEDLGRYANGLPKEQAPYLKHSFKTPTVRMLTRTAPYMHNGAFNSLEEVVEFYDHGGGVGLGLTIDNQTLPSDRLHLTPTEKQHLIAFLKALSTSKQTTTEIQITDCQGIKSNIQVY